MYAPTAIVYHPVDPDRATKAYFFRWYYNAGRSITRAWPPPENVVHNFGVPRWIFRSLARNVTRWTFSLEEKKRWISVTCPRSAKAVEPINLILNWDAELKK
jgi:hypothetical protein